MTLNLNPQAMPSGSAVTSDDFLSGTPDTTIDGRASSNPDYTWAVAHGDLYLRSGGGVYAPAGDGMALLDASGYSFTFSAAFASGSDFASTTMGVVYGYDFSPGTLEAGGRFFGAIGNRLKLYALEAVSPGSSPVLGQELYDLGDAGLSDGAALDLGVLRDGWYTRLSSGSATLLEIADVGMYLDGDVVAEGIYLVSSTPATICTGVDYGALTLADVKEREMFMLPFQSSTENGSISNRTPLYNSCYAYSASLYASGSVNAQVLVDFYQDDILNVFLASTILAGERAGVSDFSASPPLLSLATPANLVSVARGLDDSLASLTAILEVIPAWAVDAINNQTFTPGAFRLVSMGSTSSATDMDGLYPRLHTAYVNAPQAKFAVVDGTASLDGSALSLNGCVLTNIQSGSFVAALDWGRFGHALDQDTYAGIAFGCDASGSGFGAVLYGSDGENELRLYTLASGSLGSLLYNSGSITGFGFFYDLLVGGYGSAIHVCTRGGGIFTGEVLAQTLATLSPAGTWGGLIGNAGDMVPVSFTVYLAHPHILIGGSLMSYDSYGMAGYDAGDANCTTPWSLEHAEIVNSVDAVYTWGRSVNSQDPITTGVPDSAIYRTGTQGIAQQTLVLSPDASAAAEDPVYHQYGLKRPFYLMHGSGS